MFFWIQNFIFWIRNFTFWIRNFILFWCEIDFLCQYCKFCCSNKILSFEIEAKFQKIQNFFIVSKIQNFVIASKIQNFVITSEIQNFVIVSKMQNFFIASKMQILVTSQNFKKIKILLRNDKIASKKTKIVPKTKIPVQKWKMQNYVFNIFFELESSFNYAPLYSK